MKYRNYYGEIITGEREFINPNFYHVGPDNKKLPNWIKNDIIDENGFDKTNVEKNGNYIMEIELCKGTLLCRYGFENGYFTTYLGVPYEQLGLPWTKETQPYYEYEVIADGYTVHCIVTKGVVAPMFGSKGGAIQFKHKHSLQEEVDVYHTLRRLNYEKSIRRTDS